MNRISLKNNYIKIHNEVATKGDVGIFGGSQEWFEGLEYQNFARQGCGAIAAIDVALYLIDKRTVSMEEYRYHVKEFLKGVRLAGLFMKEIRIRKYGNSFAVGITPKQIYSYLNKKMTITGKNIRFRWNGINGNANMYRMIKIQIAKDIPVILGLYSKGKSIRLYSLENIEDIKYQDTGISINSHYVTVTAVVENDIPNAPHRRMLEVSSWGRKYFIDYDEYLDFVGQSFISKYCSNIISVKYLDYD